MSGPALARLFVALELPDEVRSSLAAWARRARRGRAAVRLVDSEMLHVTLCFLGSRALDEVDVLADAVAGCARAVGELSLGAPLWLPTRRPRVLAVEVHDGTGALGELQATLAAALAEAVGWEPDKRRFRPHVTVARMRQGAAPRERELEPTPALRFQGQALTLYRSFLSPSGSVYQPLEQVELG